MMFPVQQSISSAQPLFAIGILLLAILLVAYIGCYLREEAKHSSVVHANH